jgi:hypothetical protein
LQQTVIWLHRAVSAGYIVIMEALAALGGEPFVRVPFVTSIVLVMALPDSGGTALCRDRGHVLSCAAGLVALAALGPGERQPPLPWASPCWPCSPHAPCHRPASMPCWWQRTACPRGW